MDSRIRNMLLAALPTGVLVFLSGSYRDNSPIKQELLRLHALGKLDSAEQVWFGSNPPPEELYDVRTDPHEVNNLADDPAHQDLLNRMSEAVDQWMDETGDMGELPELQMVERMWPGGVQPTTSPPVLRRFSPGDSTEAPVVLRLYCKTQGASIAYTTDQGENLHWHLLLCQP